MMKAPLVCSLFAAVAALTLSACGGGDHDQPATPAGTPAPSPAPAPAPGPAPAPAPGPAPAPSPEPSPAPAPAPKTWKDADCATNKAGLPTCSVNFSDNFASAQAVMESGAPAIRLQTSAAPSASAKSRNNGVYGNKSVFGLDLLHKVKLAEFPGISFAMKLNPANTTAVDAYVNYVVSTDCSGTAGSWVNLVTVTGNMTQSAADANGYVTYSVAPGQAMWAKTGTSALIKDGITLLKGVNAADAAPMSLDALVAAYPQACIYNFPHVDGTRQLDGGITPAVMFNLGDSGTTTDKKYWIQGIDIGDKKVFPVAAPAAVDMTVSEADCTLNSLGLPACSMDFSDNHASSQAVLESGAPAIRLETNSTSSKAGADSRNNGVKGNKAVFGTDLAHKVKLSDLPRLSFAMKLNSGDSTILDDAYVTYTVSRTCDGTNWMNLITMASNMSPTSADANGYVTYSAAPSDAKWSKTGSTPFPNDGSTVLVKSALGANAGTTSLAALIAAYPEACVYNFPHPAGGVTPAVVFNLGDSNTVTAKKSWLKDITVGSKTVY